MVRRLPSGTSSRGDAGDGTAAQARVVRTEPVRTSSGGG